MNTNPLIRFYRVPKLYVKLPTNGELYPPNFLETAINGELAVYPMSAVDEMLMRTPDALFNGDSLLKVIKNCVPGVKNPKDLLEPDINTLLLAIRIASNGAIMDLDIACPQCSHENSFQVNLQHLLDTQTALEDDCTIDLDNELIIKVRPYDFSQRHMQILNEIQQGQTITQLQNSDDADLEKVAKIAQVINDMANRTFDIVAKSIESIQIKSTGELVTDQKHLAEFMSGISKTQSDVIINKIRELNQLGVDANISFACNSCKHEWNQQVDFDPSSFFA